MVTSKAVAEQLPSACPVTAGGREDKSFRGTAAGRPERQGSNYLQLKGHHWEAVVTTKEKNQRYRPKAWSR